MQNTVKSQWLVACVLAGPDSESTVLAKQGVKQKIQGRMVPWGAVATRTILNDKLQLGIDGKAYCFLPLPTFTGLQVHLNSFFELSSNRRDLWKGDSMASERAAMKAKWNEALKRDVIAPAFNHLLKQLVTFVNDYKGQSTNEIESKEESVIKIWPTFDKVDSDWREVMNEFYRIMWNNEEPVVWSERNKEWISLKQTVVEETTKDEEQEKEMIEQKKIKDIVMRELMKKGGCKIVRLKEDVKRSIVNSAKIELNEMCPALLRNVLKRPSKNNNDNKNQNQNQTLEEIAVLLEYCVRDAKYNDLIGVKLVPMQGFEENTNLNQNSLAKIKRFKSYSNEETQNNYYLVTEEQRNLLLEITRGQSNDETIINTVRRNLENRIVLAPTGHSIHTFFENKSIQNIVNTKCCINEQSFNELITSS